MDKVIETSEAGERQAVLVGKEAGDEIKKKKKTDKGEPAASRKQQKKIQVA